MRGGWALRACCGAAAVKWRKAVCQRARTGCWGAGTRIAARRRSGLRAGQAGGGCCQSPEPRRLAQRSQRRCGVLFRHATPRARAARAQVARGAPRKQQRQAGGRHEPGAQRSRMICAALTFSCGPQQRLAHAHRAGTDAAGAVRPVPLLGRQLRRAGTGVALALLRARRTQRRQRRRQIRGHGGATMQARLTRSCAQHGTDALSGSGAHRCGQVRPSRVAPSASSPASPGAMPPKKKEVVEEKPILGRFSSHLKIGAPSSQHTHHAAAPPRR